MFAAVSTKAWSVSSVPLLVTAWVAAPARSAMSILPVACTVPLLSSVPLTRRVAAPALACSAPALLNPLPAFTATRWPTRVAVAALPIDWPVNVSAVPACIAPPAVLFRLPTVLASSCPAASTAPLLTTLAAVTSRSPALCSVPLLFAVPATAIWSWAAACFDSSHVPALSSVSSVAVLPVAACAQPVAVLENDVAFNTNACSASSLPLLVTACVAAPLRAAMSMLPSACNSPLLASVPSTRSVALPLSAVATPAFTRSLPASRFRRAAFNTPALVLETSPPLATPSVPVACAVPLLVKSAAVLTARSVPAINVPLFVTLSAPTTTAPAPCRVPLFVNAPRTVSWSFASACCDNNHVPVLSMRCAFTTLPVCACTRAAAVLAMVAA